jgi:hypothetical protein
MRTTKRRHRGAPVQLYLNFPQIPLPLEGVWEQLSEDDQAAALEALAQLIAKATIAEAEKEPSYD